jgi:hypothetical protein
MQDTAPTSTLGLTLAATFTVLLTLATAAPAHADLIPPEVAHCQNSRVGAPCSTSSNSELDGTCQPATCSRRSYDHDAQKWGEEEYECLRCESTNNATRWLVLLVCVLGGLGLAYYVRTVSRLKAEQSASSDASDASEKTPEEDTGGR